jgi:two-component system sensor histidine kinase/response regulator
MSFASPIQKTPRWQALVAEDSVIHQRLALSILNRRGFQVTVVNNGREAVVASRDFAFDLILMDVEMPVLDGCAATRQIRVQEMQHGLHVPIVAVTALEDRERVLNAGMDSYIPKPLSAAALDDILHQLVADTACC